MATDTINVTSVSAAGGVGEITYNIVTNAPAAGACLGYEAIAKVEVWVHTSNNRALASKVGDAYVTALGTQYKITGLAVSSTRYAWFRAINHNVGDFYPVSATGGIAATSSNQVPPAGSVGPLQTSGNFTSLSAISGNFGNITAGNVTGVTFTGNTFTGNIFKTAISGRRVEINAADNFVRVYSNAGTWVASLGDDPSTLEPNVIFVVDRDSATANVRLSNDTGVSLSVVGREQVFGNGNRSALDISHLTSGGVAHGITFATNGGGAGVCGVSSAAGGWAFYQNSGGIGPFTGAHPGLLPKDATAEIGDILVDGKVIERHGISDTVTEVAPSSAMAQRAPIGVLAARTPFGPAALQNMTDVSRRRRSRYARIYDLATINSVGEGQINVCGRGGDMEPGDFICTSDLPGKGQRQNGPDGMADDFRRRCTVARVRERVTFKSADEVRLVACIYECG